MSKVRALVTAILLIASAIAAEPDFSSVPGVVINHIPASEGRYVGSPSIALLPDSSYVTSHDEFGPKSQYHTEAFTNVFRSEDRGATWKQVARIEGGLWSSLFAHRGAVYLIGTHREYGDVLVRRSLDGGHTWTSPDDHTTGRIARGEYHTAPVPVIVHKGRIWRGIENATAPGGWGERYCAVMMSAPEGADLLRAESWTFSNALQRDPAWLNNTFKGYLEGNAVVTRRGDIVDILRVDYRPGPEKAAVVRISDDGKTATFDPEKDFIDFPGGSKKFTIRYDDQSRRYWSLTNVVPPQFSDRHTASVRNALALTSSRNLRKWTVHCVLLYHPEVVRHAFQYNDWQFENDDIVAVSRTAYDDGLGGAERAHDANFMTFHRIQDFRALSKKTADLNTIEPLLGGN